MSCLSSGMWVQLSFGDEFGFSAARMLQTKNDCWVSLGTKFKSDSKPWLTRNINTSKFFIAYDFGRESMGHKETRLFLRFIQKITMLAIPWGQ